MDIAGDVFSVWLEDRVTIVLLQGSVVSRNILPLLERSVVIMAIWPTSHFDSQMEQRYLLTGKKRFSRNESCSRAIVVGGVGYCTA